MAENHADDGAHLRAMAEDGVTVLPGDGAKVGDKTKFDEAKYPADRTKSDVEHVDDDQIQSDKATDEL